ncbi:hypothetical protein [Novosphingobium colocasiae]
MWVRFSRFELAGWAGVGVSDGAAMVLAASIVVPGDAAWWRAHERARP